MEPLGATPPPCPICDGHDFEVAAPFRTCLACQCVTQAWPFDTRRAALFAAQDIPTATAERRASARRIVDFLQGHVHGRRLFEVGFGDAAVLAAAAAKSWQVAGIDRAPAALAHAPDLAATCQLGDFLERSAFDHEVDAHRYDVVLFSYSLEQCDDAHAALRAAHDMLVDDGIVYVELVPMSALTARSAASARDELPLRVLFPEAEHVRELLWRAGFTIREESPGIGWRWIAGRAL
ncbi:MAG TPA: methyltransferase domain-containing protein [Planctomycetota bacterium]|nr:methyltransferase domain-containing protein [Planctomycetota bacterium]